VVDHQGNTLSFEFRKVKVRTVSCRGDLSGIKDRIGYQNIKYPESYTF
jgi:hypothetical protein